MTPSPALVALQLKYSKLKPSNATYQDKMDYHALVKGKKNKPGGDKTRTIPSVTAKALLRFAVTGTGTIVLAAY